MYLTRKVETDVQASSAKLLGNHFTVLDAASIPLELLPFYG
jgi:hypothetical protein